MKPTKKYKLVGKLVFVIYSCGVNDLLKALAYILSKREFYSVKCKFKKLKLHYVRQWTRSLKFRPAIFIYFDMKHILKLSMLWCEHFYHIE